MATKTDPLTGDEIDSNELEYAETLRNALVTGQLVGSPRPDGTWHISAPPETGPEPPQAPDTGGGAPPQQPPPFTPTKYGDNVEKWRGTVRARMPASLRDRPDADMLVDKFLHVMNGESGGDPRAKNPASTAYGLMQDIHKRREDPESQIDAAWQMISKNPNQWTDWGEGVQYEGKNFGALGTTPYGGGGTAAAQTSAPGRIKPPGGGIKPPWVGDGGLAAPNSGTAGNAEDWQTGAESILAAEQTGLQPKATLLTELRAGRGEQPNPELNTPGAVTRPHTEDTDDPLTLFTRVYNTVNVDIPYVTPALDKAREAVRSVTAPVLRPVLDGMYNYMGGAFIDLYAQTDLPGSDFAGGIHNVKEAAVEIGANLPADLIPSKAVDIATTLPLAKGVKLGAKLISAPFKASPDEIVKAFLTGAARRSPEEIAQGAERSASESASRLSSLQTRLEQVNNAKQDILDAAKSEGPLTKEAQALRDARVQRLDAQAEQLNKIIDRATGGRAAKGTYDVSDLVEHLEKEGTLEVSGGVRVRKLSPDEANLHGAKNYAVDMDEVTDGLGGTVSESFDQFETAEEAIRWVVRNNEEANDLRRLGQESVEKHGYVKNDRLKEERSAADSKRQADWDARDRAEASASEKEQYDYLADAGEELKRAADDASRSLARKHFPRIEGAADHRIEKFTTPDGSEWHAVQEPDGSISVWPAELGLDKPDNVAPFDSWKQLQESMDLLPNAEDAGEELKRAADDASHSLNDDWGNDLSFEEDDLSGWKDHPENDPLPDDPSFVERTVKSIRENTSNLSVEDLRQRFTESTNHANGVGAPDMGFGADRDYHVLEMNRYGNELWRRTRGREGFPPHDYGNGLHVVPEKEIQGFYNSAIDDAQTILDELDDLSRRIEAGEVIPDALETQKALRQEYSSALADVTKYGDELNLRAGFIEDLDGITHGWGNMNAGIPFPPQVSKAISKLLGVKGPPRMFAGSFISDLRDLSDVTAEVVTRSDIPIVKQIQQVLFGTLINPGLNATRDIAKAIVGMQRQFIAGDSAALRAVGTALDAHGHNVFKIKMFEGKISIPMRTAPGGVPGATELVNIKQGFVEIASRANPNIKGLTPIQEILENPGKFVLDARQDAYVRDFRKLMDETIDMMRRNNIELPKNMSANYVPHMANKVRDIDLIRGSNPFLERQYADILDGMANGTQYLSNPREIAHSFVRTAYNEVIREQFGSFMLGRGVNPDTMVAQVIKDRLSLAVKARDSVRRTMYNVELNLKAKVIAAPAGTPARTQAQGALSQFIKIQKPARLNTVDQAYDAARSSYTSALERASKSDVGPGYLFGMPDRDIPIGMWRNQYYPLEDAQALQKAVPEVINTHVAEGVKGALATGWDVTTRFINLGRTASAGFDMGAPFIQGHALAFYRPTAWAKATFNHYASLFDPAIAGRYMRENAAVFDEMARYGVPIGDSEFFKGIDSGLSLGKPLDYLPGGKALRRGLGAAGDQTYGRFETAFNTFLSYSRAELWKSVTADEHFFGVGISKGMANTEAAKFVRNMTGGLESAGLGVDRAQRSIEGMVLSFSPKFLRSTAGLIGLAMQPNTPAGRRAARALAQMVAGTSISIIAINKALGASDEEILDALNPLKGRKFMSAKIGDQYYGVGGFIRALTQAGANAIDNPENLTKMSQDNPLVQLYLSRSAPGYTQGAAVVQAIGGPTLDPYSKVNNFHSYATHLMQGFMPFGLAPAVTGDLPSAPGAALGSIALSESGVRVSPVSQAEKMQDLRDSTVKQMIAENLIPSEHAKYFQDWESLSPVARKFVNDEVAKRYPKAVKDYEDFRHEDPSVFVKISDEADRIKNKEFKPAMDKLQARLLAGDSPKAVWTEYDALRNELQGKMHELYHGNLGDSKEYQNSVKDLEYNDMRALWDKWNALPEDTKNKTGGKYDFDKVQDARREFLLDLDNADPALTSRFLFELKLQKQSAAEESHPLIQMREQVQQSLQPYYNLLDSGADQRTLTMWMAAHPDADYGNWFIAKSDTPAIHSLAAAEMVLKTLPDKRDVHLAGTNLQITTGSLPALKQYDQQITQLLIMPRSQIIAGKETNPVTTLRKNSPLSDALYFWLGFSKPDKGEDWVGVYNVKFVLDFLKRVGPRSDGVRPRQIVN